MSAVQLSLFLLLTVVTTVLTVVEAETEAQFEHRLRDCAKKIDLKDSLKYQLKKIYTACIDHNYGQVDKEKVVNSLATTSNLYVLIVLTGVDIIDDIPEKFAEDKPCLKKLALELLTDRKLMGQGEKERRVDECFTPDLDTFVQAEVVKAFDKFLEKYRKEFHGATNKFYDDNKKVIEAKCPGEQQCVCV